MLGSPYGWLWDGFMWKHRRVPIDIWTPFQEAASHDAVQARYKRWAETPGGKGLDAFVAHFTACKTCGQNTSSKHEVRDIEDHCPEGASLWAALEPKWKAWLWQLHSDQTKGKRLKAGK